MQQRRKWLISGRTRDKGGWAVNIDSIVDQMERLKQLHESLLTVSNNKTEALKSNDTEALQGILAQERKHVQAINSLEKKRLAVVAEWSVAAGFTHGDPTVSDILDVVEGAERERLQETYDSFIIVLADLKQQEVLNAELTKQSLQFIHVSLDLLQPSLSQMNYGKPAGTEGQKRPVFDSKA
ncbi:flagellar protein FlgN [Halobacillus shinanisalinarum]|uniref:Flagellar protein FlgN n=1 Tax=Halobacillus shinanisalinarum TaxID=2932258 RepID=A0ABY4H2J5_9BACI|nr:flagellar protein FlgN [Halobacillus shinanisalinarum]UOQ94401.1 flagellar protein FlgN [Halobacillus shinanisalinarum]